jgi:DNA-binding PadR family transcriptional regulator
MPPRRAQDYLPLTHLGFHVLLALADAPLHGYAIVRAVRERSAGKVDPGTGSFYSVIHGLSDLGLVEAADGPDGVTDVRRRYYTVTTLGRAVLRAEAARLKSLVLEVEQLGAAASRPMAR